MFTLNSKVSQMIKKFEGDIATLQNKLAIASLLIGEALSTKLDGYRTTRQLTVSSVATAEATIAALQTYVVSAKAQIAQLDDVIEVGEEMEANQIALMTVEIPELVAQVLGNQNIDS